MKIDKINLYTYELPLTKTLNINNQLIELRQGAIICLSDKDGNKGFGEIAPLPGLHPEKYNDVLDQLNKICRELIDTNVIDTKKFFDSIGQIPGYKYWYPSVRFGIESALINLAKILEADFPNIVRDDPFRNNISVNALVAGDRDIVLDTVSQKLSENFKCIKLKVGRDTIEKDVDIVQVVAKLIKNKATFRLDANRAWDLPTAINFLTVVKNCTIEFIEEPLQNPAQLPDLFKKTNIPFALDESLTDQSLDITKSQSWIKALVIKPSVIGSVSRTFQLIKFARKTGLSAVISDTFQSGIGLSFLAWIASFVEKDTPMGFDTYQSLADDILIDRLNVVQGNYFLKDVLQKSMNIDFSKLKILSI